MKHTRSRRLNKKEKRDIQPSREKNSFVIFIDAIGPWGHLIVKFDESDHKQRGRCNLLVQPGTCAHPLVPFFLCQLIICMCTSCFFFLFISFLLFSHPTRTPSIGVATLVFILSWQIRIERHFGNRRRFVFATRAERRPAVFAMARWFKRINRIRVD